MAFNLTFNDSIPISYLITPLSTQFEGYPETSISLVLIFCFGYVSCIISLLIVHILIRCILKIHHNERLRNRFVYGYDLDGYQV